MLATRTSAVRTASTRIARRSFASVSDAAGFKVATVDNNQPTSAITLLFKAGSRYETKPGVANGLKNFAFKSTAKRSALGTVREAELYGGVLSATLSREHLALTAEFLRGDEEFFVDVLSSFATSAKFTRHEFEEYVVPVIECDSTTAHSDPAINAVELAHGLAFRNGLGSSLFASTHSSFTHADIKEYAASALSKGNLVALGSGISQETLAKLVEKAFGSASAGAASTTKASSYHGGETRVDAHSGPETVFIGFGATGAPSSDLAVLNAHLSTTPSIKWSKGLSPLAASLPEGSSVQTVYLPYSDASLFGLLVQAETPEGVRQAGQIAVKALKDATSGKNISEEALKGAIAKAKFASASALEGREGLFATLGPKVAEGKDASVAGVVAAFDAVNASSFSKAAAELVKSKPTFVAIGNTTALPHADELGL
jgi:ubiquinol-cytochrome c reductase core subunit 2